MLLSGFLSHAAISSSSRQLQRARQQDNCRWFPKLTPVRPAQCPDRAHQRSTGDRAELHLAIAKTAFETATR